MGFLISPEVFGKTDLISHLFNLKSILAGETISYVGLIYYVFLIGLDMNLDTIIKARKKATSIAVAGIIIPMAMGGCIYALVQKLYTGNSDNFSAYNTSKAYLFWTLTLSITGFPILAHILADLKLLYTGLGKVALTAAMINDFYNWLMFALLTPFAIHDEKAIYSVLSTIAFILFFFFVLRPHLVRLIVRKTNQNEWDNYQLSYVIMGAYVCAAITDILGTHPIVGALVYGIMIPRGKFTTMLIEMSEDFAAGYLVPLFFFTCGIRLKLVTLFKTQSWIMVVGIVLLSCIPKILSTVITTQFFGMTTLDGVALGILMNTKGILPLIMLNTALDKKVFINFLVI